METAVFEITGVTPLVQHNPAKMQKGDVGAMSRKKIPSPEEEAEAGAYRLPDGQLYLPARAVQAAIFNAAKGRRFGKFAAGAILAGSVFLTEEILPLVHPKTRKPIKEISGIDTRRVMVQRQGVMRSRPKIDEWQTRITFEYDAEVVKAETIHEILTIAGSRVGVLELRPQSKAGACGRFVAAQVS